MSGITAQLGFICLKAKRVGHSVDFSDESRELFWHAADNLSLIKDRFIKNKYRIPDASIMRHLDKYIDNLFLYSETNNNQKKITYLDHEVIGFYLDQLREFSSGDEMVNSMIDSYINHDEHGFKKLKEFSEYRQIVSNIFNEPSI